MLFGSALEDRCTEKSDIDIAVFGDMSKGKYQVELKIKIVQEYLTGKQSVKSLAKQYGVGVTSIKEWIFTLKI